MKKKFTFLFSLIFIFSLLLLAPKISAQGSDNGSTEWSLDKAHTKIGFAATHMGISEVEGSFKEFDGSLTSMSDDFVGSKVQFTAQTTSVTTGNDRRDGHLKSPDFFDAENHSELKFSGEIVKEGDEYFLVGDLTIRDVTKSEKFDLKYNGTVQGGKGPVSGFKIQGMINRFDYNLKFDRALPGGDLIVGKNVDITANIEIGAKKEE